FTCRVVKINHPRDGQGYFDLVGYDPAVGPSSALPGRFDLTFDAIEVWNSGDDWDHLATRTLPDWYSFLNRGYRKIATGNSDSHELTQWAGQPHNLVRIDGDLTETAFYDALMAGHGQVTAAAFIEFHIDAAGLGDTVVPDTPNDPVQAEIRISAPSWAPLDTVRLIGNGEVVQEWDVSGAEDVVRLDEVADLFPVVDTWYHVVAFDTDQDLAPVYPGRTSAAFTNPIWVDRDGDGFDPPVKDDLR
ncbi:MAG: CehA/McbA family metallohydrolase, partial [Lentisphaerae bacterium]|nr:CehA/McbA family metallohydrolase [Lentisphaerota bacterium]